jgi:hypothetical protein
MSTFDASQLQVHEAKVQVALGAAHNETAAQTMYGCLRARTRAQIHSMAWGNADNAAS